MSLDDVCLAAQQIQELHTSGRLVTRSALSRERFQSSSFEPHLMDEGFILDASPGLLRPVASESVYRALLRLPQRHRQRFSIDDSSGFTLLPGFHYLFPLDTSFKVADWAFALSSPKSSLGRLFVQSRALFDYSDAFDAVHGAYVPDVPLANWLLVQPRVFGLTVYPGMAMNQLRFFTGSGAQLSATELESRFSSAPLLFHLTEDLSLVAAPHVIDAHGLRLHLDVQGRRTSGVVALRARRTPLAIDTRLRNLCAEDYFEPIFASDGKVNLSPHEHYLFASAEVLSVPLDISIHLQRYSPVGLVGALDDAGFFDNGFFGDIVFEVSSHEPTILRLSHGMPVSCMNLFRTPPTDKPYGPEIGSHYQGQVGTRVSKFHKGFDYSRAARDAPRMNRDVLVCSARELLALRSVEFGFAPLADDSLDALFSTLGSGFFQSRYDCEEDDLVLQPIPYEILFGPDRTVFCYQRAENQKDYGDQRLFSKYSVAVGGHIGRSDDLVSLADSVRGRHLVASCCAREIKEEIRVDGDISDPYLLGTLYTREKPVDRVHFGLIYGQSASGAVFPVDPALRRGLLIPLDTLISSPPGEFETWSRLLLPHLPELYERIIR